MARIAVHYLQQKTTSITSITRLQKGVLQLCDVFYKSVHYQYGSKLAFFF
jgi:hypothetical protein